jgi:hypothetical protein
MVAVLKTAEARASVGSNPSPSASNTNAKPFYDYAHRWAFLVTPLFSTRYTFTIFHQRLTDWLSASRAFVSFVFWANIFIFEGNE